MKKKQNEKIHETVDRMLEMDRIHRTVCDRELSQIGLYRSQHRMLMHLHFHGGVASQRELARELNISPAVVNVTLHKLEAEGYIVRLPTETDRRMTGIELTVLGKEIVNQTHSILDRVDAEMLRGFSDEELAMATSFFRRMKENLLKN